MPLRITNLSALVLLLAALAGGCSRRADVPVPSSAGRVALFEHDVARVRFGKTDLTEAAQRPMGISGWEAVDVPAGSWVWSQEQTASLWVAVSADAPDLTELRLEVRAPGILSEDFSLAARVNGQNLGELALPHDKESLVFALPPGACVPGLNRVELRGSHWESPKDQGRGPDPRRLSFQFRSASLGVEGAWLLVRRVTPPRGANLAGEWGSQLLVQRLDSPRPQAAREQLPVAGSTELAFLYPTRAGEPAPDVRLGGLAGYTNLILIVVDTLRDDALDLVPTPNIDRIVAEGVRYTRAFSNAPMTLPSHTSFFSSRLPSTSGLVNNGQRLPPELPLLPQALRSEGYSTLGVVSIGTLWFVVPGTTLDRSFAEYLSAGPLIPGGDATQALLKERIEAGALVEPFFLFAHFADPHVPYRDHGPPKEAVELELDGKPLWSFQPKRGELLERDLDLSAGEHRFSFHSPDLAVGLLTFELRQAGRPVPVTYDAGGTNVFQNEMLARIQLEAPAKLHPRMWASDLPFGAERIYRYAGEVGTADAAVGRLIDTLESQGLWSNSLVVFLSDHGEAFSEHGYNGHVQTLYDEMLHVPLVLRPPLDAAWDPVREHLRADSPSVFPLTDLAPTILALLGRQPLPGSEGHSHLAALPSSSVLLAETHRPEAFRDLYCLRDNYWKLILDPTAQEFQLFDLLADPGEHNDLFASRGAEFSDWCDRLWKRASRFSAAPETPADPEMRADLEALGY